jgi:hypothetical protein
MNWGGKRKGAGRAKGSTKEKRVVLKVFVLPETKHKIKNDSVNYKSMGKYLDGIFTQ